MPYESYEKVFYVYLMASQKKGAIYTGMTANMSRRRYEHANGLMEGFGKDRQTDILVYFEQHPSFESAKKREKRVKHWKREWKVEMIEARNPTWMDLSRRLL